MGTKDNYDSFGLSKCEHGIEVHRDEELIEGASLGWKARSLAFDLLGSRSSLFIQGEMLSSTFCTVQGKICAGVVSLGVTNSTTLYITLRVRVTC